MNRAARGLFVLSLATCMFAGVVGVWALYLVLTDQPEGVGRGLGIPALVGAALYAALGAALALFARRRVRR